MFRALTGGLSQNDQKNRLDPGLGVVKVADSRLDFLTKYHKPKKVTPVHVEFTVTVSENGVPGQVAR